MDNNDKKGSIEMFNFWRTKKYSNICLYIMPILILFAVTSFPSYVEARQINQIFEDLKIKNNLEAREKAAKEILDSHGKNAFKPMKKILYDKNESIGIRTFAMFILVKIDANRAVGPLIHILSDDDDKGLESAVSEALVEIGQPVVESLKIALKGEDKRVRLAVVWIFSRIGGKDVVEPLIEALNDDYTFVRFSAAYILGKLGDKKAIISLKAALNDEDNIVRESASSALGRLGEKRPVIPLDQIMSKNLPPPAESCDQPKAYKKEESSNVSETKALMLKFLQRAEQKEKGQNGGALEGQ